MAAGEQEVDQGAPPVSKLRVAYWIGGRVLGPVLLVLCIIVAGLFADARGLLAASRGLSCAAFSFRDSEPQRSSRHAAENLNASQVSSGFDVALTNIRLPCSRFFRVAPTACTLALGLRNQAALRLETPILLSDIRPSQHTTGGEPCNAATVDARTTIPVSWLPALLRASVNGTTGADLDSVDVADSMSVVCRYSVALCVFGDALCISAYDSNLTGSVPVSSLIPALAVSPSAASQVSGTPGDSSNPTGTAASSAPSVATSARAPALTIPMSASAASAFSVTETVDVDVAGVNLELEACLDCSAVPEGPSPWAPLYSLAVGGVQSHCSREVLDGAFCVVSLDVRSLQHSLPDSWLASIGSVVLPALVSELASLPAPLKSMILAALSLQGSDESRGVTDRATVVNLRVVSHLNASLSCSNVWDVVTSKSGHCTLEDHVASSALRPLALCSLASAAALLMHDCGKLSADPTATDPNADTKDVAVLWGANLIIQDCSNRLASCAGTTPARRVQLDPNGSNPSLYWTLYSQSVQSSLYNWTLAVNTHFSASDTGFFSAYVFGVLLSHAANVNVGLATTAEVHIDPQWQLVPGASFIPSGGFPSGTFRAAVPRLSSQWWHASCGGASLTTAATATNSIITVHFNVDFSAMTNCLQSAAQFMHVGGSALNELFVQVTPSGADPAPPGANISLAFSLSGSAAGSGGSVTLPLPLYRFGWARTTVGYGGLRLWAPLTSSLVVGGTALGVGVILPAGPTPAYSIPSYNFAITIASTAVSLVFSGLLNVSTYSPAPTCWAGGAAQYATMPKTSGVCISASASGIAPWSITMPIRPLPWSVMPRWSYSGVTLSAVASGNSSFPSSAAGIVPVPSLSALLTRVKVDFGIAQLSSVSYASVPCGKNSNYGTWTCDVACIFCLLSYMTSQGNGALNVVGFGTVPQGQLTLDAQSVARYAFSDVLPTLGSAAVGVAIGSANAAAYVQCAISPAPCSPWWAPGTVSAQRVSSTVNTWAARLYSPSTWSGARWAASAAVAFSRDAGAPPIMTGTMSGTGRAFNVVTQWACALNISSMLNTIVRRVCAPVSQPIIINVGFSAGTVASMQGFPLSIDFGVTVSALDSAASALGGWFGCDATCMYPAYAPVSLFVRSALSALLPVSSGDRALAPSWQWRPCALPTVTATATPGSSPSPQAGSAGTAGPPAVNIVGIAVGVTVSVLAAVAAGLAGRWYCRARHLANERLLSTTIPGNPFSSGAVKQDWGGIHEAPQPAVQVAFE